MIASTCVSDGGNSSFNSVLYPLFFQQTHIYNYFDGIKGMQ